jgi:hypothetical protein
MYAPTLPYEKTRTTNSPFWRTDNAFNLDHQPGLSLLRSFLLAIIDLVMDEVVKSPTAQKTF